MLIIILNNHLARTNKRDTSFYYLHHFVRRIFCALVIFNAFLLQYPPHTYLEFESKQCSIATYFMEDFSFCVEFRF